MSFFLSAQEVLDELEYIKMRYRSPARSSFRNETRINAGYNSLTLPAVTTDDSDDSLNGFDSAASGRRIIKKSHNMPPPHTVV